MDIRTLLMSALLLAGGSSLAIAAHTSPAAIDADVQASMSAAKAAISPEDYRVDGGFNGGKLFLDRFDGPGSNDYRGRFVVAVPDGENAPNPDGDVLVVGEVPGYLQGPNQNGFTNIGIVRYNRHGVRQPLRGAHNYGFGGTPNTHPYVIMPNDEVTRANGMRRLVAVTQVHNGYFYVLTDEHYSVPPAVNLIFLRRFRANGSYMDSVQIAASRSDTQREDLFGIDMTLHHDGASTSVMILARQVHEWTSPVITGCDEAFGCSVFVKVPLAADGAPTYNEADGILPVRSAVEDTGDSFTFRPTSIASGPRGGLSPLLYVAGEYYTNANGPAPRVKVKQYNSATDYVSQFKPIFRGVSGRAESGGRLLVRADRPGGYHHVYLAVQTEQQCAPGIGVAKISDAGSLVSGFANGGKLLFGGNDDTPDSQACAYAKGALQLGMAMDDDGRLAIVGQMDEDVDWNGTYPTGMLSVVDATSGTLIDFAGHFWRAPDGYPIGQAAFYGVVPSGGGSFTVAGDQRDQANGNRLMFTTGRIAGESLFGDGFE